MIADLSGFKIRMGELNNPPITLADGSQVTFTTQKVLGDSHQISVNYSKLPAMIRQAKARRVLLDGVKGMLELTVLEVVDDSSFVCQVIKGGQIRGRIAVPA